MLTGTATRAFSDRAFFDQSDIAHAQFVISRERQGALHRSSIPSGTKAELYNSSTPTSQIAVRGTEGDISVDSDNLTLNVYSSTISEGVQVTFTKGNKAGSSINVLPGQSLVANLVNGIIQTQVNAITQAAMDKFAELGVPTTAAQAQNTVIEKAKAALPKIKLPF